MAFLGIKFMKGEFSKLVDSLKKADKLGVDTEARANILNDVETALNKLDSERSDKDDKRKIKAVRVLLETLKAEGDVSREVNRNTLQEQQQLYSAQSARYKNLFGQSLSETFLNTNESPAPASVKEAKAALNASLSSLSKLINVKHKSSKTYKAKQAADKKEQTQRIIQQDLVPIFRSAYKMPEVPMSDAEKVAKLRANLNAEKAKNEAKKIAELRRELGMNRKGGAKTRKGSRKTRKGSRKGKKGTRKH